ncbi:MAG: 1-(5-phosphoribosyl)-5-((5-phosphoribosylamino)methylideneamino)imidazole-4-carboxamide isomerase, partial [Epsilonproteobacteria bacterium]|nr:1-(5-phosphoribosyl)-5-((5-phosphoribosylamino)methylideneamino)imidazole-4-carboxamide isomerase [Campylobacterota bacterium]
VLLKHSRKVAGVIVGKAFYEGTLDLREAFARCS